jgi:peptidoglycan L-alanyl-D-glutamate endopeptidase CwlK
MAQFDPRSEKNIKTLAPTAQEKARVFLQAVRDAGINAKIIDGSRTFKEQDGVLLR